MQEWWQHLPELINPIAFSIGFISFHWYALFFIGGTLASLFLGIFLIRKGESILSEEEMFDIFLFIFIGASIGGRVGYVLFYNLGFFLESPLSIFSPYDFHSGVWTGISGMSFHGGLIGAGIALFFFVQKQKNSGKNIAFWETSDFLSLLVPVAIFFGRLGNFLNVELYGRVTSVSWGMFFPTTLESNEVLRHPSALYEAFLEGIVLFFVLYFFRKKMPFLGLSTCLFLLGYAIVRFIGEYFREPDSQMGFFLGGAFSFGQVLSCVMIIVTAGIFFWLRKQNRAILMVR
ncbi:MAG: prolipoprotein diacylglyceryl transferase [Candidatus Moranbacteria bacterium]|nr:prolipoprotein diacylglyceryl transferase [Candidatus Moranbacteria bacterium]MDD3964711.1 prolipoprotein diacylglyceryl transferase [Candidatus Moranbacteria bacterium]